MTINNDNGIGFTMWINAYQGSNFFSGSYTANDWNAESGSYMFAGSPTTTWGTTAGATWDITGFQLEVGPEATPFETRSYADELLSCQRYFEKMNPKLFVLGRYSHHNGAPYNQYHFKAEKRAVPTCSLDTTGGTFESSTGYSGNPSFTDTTVDSTTIYGANSVTAGGILYIHTSSGGLLKFSAEL